jgi:hypothetical protein
MKTNPIVIAAVSAVMLSSCSMDFPKTRAEFTDHPQIQKDTYTVPRNLDAVVASLDKQAKRCVNGETVETRMGGGGLSTSRDLYMMTLAKTSPSRAELTYRQASNNMAFQPEGGFFRLAANLEAQGGKSTKVTIYHGPLQKTLINAVKEWSKGNDHSCHGYGGR